MVLASRSGNERTLHQAVGDCQRHSVAPAEDSSGESGKAGDRAREHAVFEKVLISVSAVAHDAAGVLCG